MKFKILGIIASSIFSASAYCADVLVAPTGADDWQNMQNVLNAGNTVVLMPGASYTINQRLNITRSNTGIITKEATPATINMSAAFNYANPDITKAGPRLDQTNAIGIYIGQDLAIPITDLTNISNITLRNFHLKKIHIDGTYVNGIRAMGVSNIEISKVEMSGFSLGYIVALDSVSNVQIKYSTIRDSWANVAPKDSNGHYFPHYPQLTGIQIDDNKVKIISTGENVLSKNISIVNNTISRLRIGKALFNTGRNQFIADGSTNPVGYESDGIDIGGSDSPLQGGKFNVVVAMNEISEVGEGIDTFGANYLIDSNVISDTYLFGVKLVHGARDAVVQNNTINRARYAGIVLAGSSQARAHVSGNLIRGNDIQNTGNRDFTCTNVAGDPNIFKLADLNCRSSSYSGVFVQANSGTETTGMVKNNFIIENKINGGIKLEGVAINTTILGNNITGSNAYLEILPNATGTITDVEPGYILGSAYQQEPKNSKLVRADINGDKFSDFFVSWDESGKNYLYLNSPNKLGNIFTRVDDAIPRTGINNYPSRLLSGNFDGSSDGKMDLMFTWDASGQNRVLYNFSNGAFTSASNANPIPPASINNYPTDAIVADFDGNGKDDVCFIWKSSGLNRCAWSQGISNFFTYAEIISPNAINGSANDILTGDFNGDGKADLYFIWRADGVNRLFYGNTAGSFTTYQDSSGGAPIGINAINGNPDKVIARDFNIDGITDIDFMWSSVHVKRLFLGRTSGPLMTE